MLSIEDIYIYTYDKYINTYIHIGGIQALSSLEDIWSSSSGGGVGGGDAAKVGGVEEEAVVGEADLAGRESEGRVGGGGGGIRGGRGGEGGRGEARRGGGGGGVGVGVRLRELSGVAQWRVLRHTFSNVLSLMTLYC